VRDIAERLNELPAAERAGVDRMSGLIEAGPASTVRAVRFAISFTPWEKGS
jgi:hypothetical protein